MLKLQSEVFLILGGFSGAIALLILFHSKFSLIFFWPTAFFIIVGTLSKAARTSLMERERRFEEIESRLENIENQINKKDEQ